MKCLLLLALPLSSCITRIPDAVLDANWCRDMESGLARADERGRRNLTAAMEKHRCGEKLATAQTAAKSDLR